MASPQCVRSIEMRSNVENKHKLKAKARVTLKTLIVKLTDIHRVSLRLISVSLSYRVDLSFSFTAWENICITGLSPCRRHTLPFSRVLHNRLFLLKPFLLSKIQAPILSILNRVVDRTFWVCISLAPLSSTKNSSAIPAYPHGQTQMVLRTDICNRAEMLETTICFPVR